MLDAADFGRNPHGGEFGDGHCQVRFGKAKKGSPPKRRAAGVAGRGGGMPPFRNTDPRVRTGPT
ncbi:hypothetical protein [Streptomyces sp. DT203]|uniref:hypothetical protein n=1 Tax=Streptomyces sp. DT203 TaxID=3393424 RepID=UPI003CFA7891